MKGWPVVLAVAFTVLLIGGAALTVWLSGEEFTLKNNQTVFATLGAIAAAGIAYAAASAQAANQKREIYDRRRREQAGARVATHRLCSEVIRRCEAFLFSLKEPKDEEAVDQLEYELEAIKKIVDEMPLGSDLAYAFTIEEHAVYSRMSHFTRLAHFIINPRELALANTGHRSVEAQVTEVRDAASEMSQLLDKRTKDIFGEN